MKSNVNFHIHTVYSDGGRTVGEIVDGLIKNGVVYFAITDHDEIKGNIEARSLAEKHGLKHVDGVELSCCFDNEGGLDSTCVCHIVGLGFEYGKMEEKLKYLKDRKYALLDELMQELIKDGYNLDRAKVEVGGIITERKNIAYELVEKGYAVDVNAAFLEILNFGKYIKYAKNLPTVKEGIKIIHDCGGIAVWAHPLGYTRGGKKDLDFKTVSLIAEKMSEYGIDAMEAYYLKYNKEKIEFLESLGNEYRWLRSVATDYHAVKVDLKKYPEWSEKANRDKLSFDIDGVNADCEEVKALLNRLFNRL